MTSHIVRAQIDGRTLSTHLSVALMPKCFLVVDGIVEGGRVGAEWVPLFSRGDGGPLVLKCSQS